MVARALVPIVPIVTAPVVDTVDTETASARPSNIRRADDVAVAPKRASKAP